MNYFTYKIIFLFILIKRNYILYNYYYNFYNKQKR